MHDSTANVSQAPEYPNPLARADALEREITDLCAQINAASYRLLQLVAELDDEEPWGAWGLTSCAHWLNLHIAPVGPEPLSAAKRYQVVVHVTAETLAADGAGRCEFDNGQGLALDTVRRITCDGSLLRISEDDKGNPLDIGRKTCAVSPALRRALQALNGGCRFPGCSHRRFVDAHHIRHWADGGGTSI